MTTYDLADVALGYRKLEANIISVHGFRDGYAVGIVNDSACNIRESLFQICCFCVGKSSLSLE